MEKDITYRAMYLGENIEDIEENSYTSPKDNKKFIPYPSITREFDEEEDERQLNQYLKENENKKDEEMEMMSKLETGEPYFQGFGSSNEMDSAGERWGLDT